MKNLHEWELDPIQAAALVLAADARLSRTNYTDDHSWRVVLGQGDQPAISLQTQFGGRVGLASLVFLWTYDGRTIYQAQTFASPPVVVYAAPNYMHLEAQLVADLQVRVRVWVMESHALAVVLTLHNTGKAPLTLRVEAFGHVLADGKELSSGIINLRDGGAALYLSDVGNITPVAILQTDKLADAVSSTRIGASLTIAPNTKEDVQFVEAAQSTPKAALALARRWLAMDWLPYLKQIDQAAAALPQIQTGNKEWDWLLDLSYKRLIQAFIRSAGNFPYPTYVATRIPVYGYSARGDGSDHLRGWNGQDFALAYLLAPIISTIDARWAQGIIHNYLTSQASDGAIDLKPGAAGQRQNLLCPPILARITWQIYQNSPQKEADIAFLKSVFPKLLSFFQKWLALGLDVSASQLPLWQDERQLGYVAFPTFAAGQLWSQGADISTVQTPDMAAYLLSEAQSLKTIALQIGDKDVPTALDQTISDLQTLLEALWNGTRYTYRDRDTKQTPAGMILLQDGAGDGNHVIQQELTIPNRVIIRVIGGVTLVPKMTCHVEGRDADGNALTVELPSAHFRWQSRQGVATTPQVFSYIERIHCEGLSRAYRVEARTVDATGLDINAVLPLWSGVLPDAPAKALSRLVTDPQHFWRENGVTMVSAEDLRFDPSNAAGGGGIWLYWLTLIGEGLLNAGATTAAADMMKAVFNLLVDVIAKTGKFYQFYHSDEPQGSGEGEHLAGIVPLYFLNLLMGIAIPTHDTVLFRHEFAWGRSVTIRQHGVVVRRTRSSTKIKFPSGHSVELEAEAPSQLIRDPEAVVVEPLVLLPYPEEEPTSVPNSISQAQNPPQRVVIAVEYEN